MIARDFGFMLYVPFSLRATNALKNAVDANAIITIHRQVKPYALEILAQAITKFPVIEDTKTP